MTGTLLTTKFPDEDAAAAFARRIAPALRAGDTILLSGEIGAGKTHIARALIKARLAMIGRDEDVPSPTFTIVQTYEVGGVEIWHTDLYRLSDAHELVELGLEDALREAICIIEWPEQVSFEWPEDALWIRVSGNGTDTGRVATISTQSERLGELLRGVLSG